MLDDSETPNAARLYDYYLGGAHNFAPDRAKARDVIERWPNVVPVAQYNRGFLRRVVEHALDAGITQFLDLGSGVPREHTECRCLCALVRGLSGS